MITAGHGGHPAGVVVGQVTGDEDGLDVKVPYWLLYAGARVGENVGAYLDFPVCAASVIVQPEAQV